MKNSANAQSTKGETDSKSFIRTPPVFVEINTKYVERNKRIESFACIPILYVIPTKISDLYTCFAGQKKNMNQNMVQISINVDSFTITVKLNCEKWKKH